MGDTFYSGISMVYGFAPLFSRVRHEINDLGLSGYFDCVSHEDSGKQRARHNGTAADAA
jgi:hypothetical protein